jgi:hypothetical protein
MQSRSKKAKVSVEELDKEIRRGFPRDVQIEVLRRLDANSLTNYCVTSSYGRELCKDENLWRRWIETQYPLLIRFKIPSEPYKNFALRMIYAIGKNKELFKIPYIASPNFNPFRFYLFTKDSSKKKILELAGAFAAEANDFELIKDLVTIGLLDLSNIYRIAGLNNNIKLFESLKKYQKEHHLLDLQPSMGEEAAFYGAIEGNHLPLVKELLRRIKPFWIGNAFKDVLERGIVIAAKNKNKKIVKYLSDEGGEISDDELYRLKTANDKNILNYLIKLGILDQDRVDNMQVGFNL